jgi:YgiT-type zinc finger domain-containing protein
MKKGTAPFSIDRNGYHISWDTVPAWVCEQCGESLLETQEVDTIQDALAVLDRDTVSLVARFKIIDRLHLAIPLPGSGQLSWLSKSLD